MSNSPTQKNEWQILEKYCQDIKSYSIEDLFEDDPDRVNKFSFRIDGLAVDFSKQCVTQEVLNTLVKLADGFDIERKRDQMFSGEIVNITEKRAVLHTALRRPKTDKLVVDGHCVMSDIYDRFETIKKFSKDIRSKNYKGATGKPIKHIVSLGVGGSDLGPRLVCNALSDKAQDQDVPQIHFVANLDTADINEVFRNCSAEETLFVMISKSFTTQETLTNALNAREWLKSYLPEGSDLDPHFVAVTANSEAAKKFGISEKKIFPMWEWVNGRFSLWSAVGLPIFLAYGFEVFEELLRGSYEMDCHFQNTPLKENIPVLLALIGIWNNNFMEMSAHAILPYAHHLQDFPRYLQQLEMESNGKSIDLDGHPITDYKTCPVIFGEAGTMGQHSFYQLLHQGTRTISCDFIGAIKSDESDQKQQKLLLSNMLAQGQALMQGRRVDESYRDCTGNKPSTTILIDKLDAYHLGMLLALYEHKVFIQGVIWNINSFDQFGVELGKSISRQLENHDLSNADSSTKALFSQIHE